MTQTFTTDRQFEDIYRTYRPRLLRYARARNAIDPEGVADLALYDGYRAMGRLRSDQPEVIAAYLYKATRSHISREWRRPPEEPVPISDDDAADGEVDERIVGDLTMEALLRQLPPAQREVIQLRFVEDLTATETARRLGKSDSAVRQLQLRALRRLRGLAFTLALLVALAIGAVVVALASRSGTVVELGPVDPAPRVVEESPDRPTVAVDDEPVVDDASVVLVEPAVGDEPAATGRPVADGEGPDASTAGDEPVDTDPPVDPPPSPDAVTAYGVNLAYGKTARSSSIFDERFLAAYATDGHRRTRWADQKADQGWLEVDLGRTYEIDRVVILWEDAYATRYRVEVSDDRRTWRELHTTVGSDGRVDDLVGLTGAGRYVRLSGDERATEWGMSVWELEIYGPVDNLALLKPARTSSVQHQIPSLAAAGAVDGDGETRWSTEFLDEQWLEIDLGRSYPIDRIVVSWHTFFARGYRIEVSEDRTLWTVVHETSEGDGGTDELADLSTRGRYVRLIGTERATRWGLSVYEVTIHRS